MTVESAADRAAMLGDWESAVYDNAATVRGIFLNGYAEADLGLAGVSGTAPRFVCDAASVAADPSGKLLVIGTDTWTILRAEQDGTGLVRLVLEAA